MDLKKSNKKKKPMTKQRALGILAACFGGLVVLTLLVSGLSGKGKDKPAPDVSDKPAVDVQPSADESNEDWRDNEIVSDSVEAEGEDNATAGLVTDAAYKNDKMVTYAYNADGDTITFGVASGDSDMVYLNPVASSATEKQPVGFYLTSERCPLVYSNNNWSSYDSWGTERGLNFIVHHSYDELIPAAYTSNKDYGVGWRNDFLVDGKMDTGTTIYVRAVQIRSGKMLALCKVNITYDESSKSYYILSVENADVAATGEMNASDRTELLDKAFTIALNKEFGPTDPEYTEDFRETAIAGGFVQKMQTLYFPKVLDYAGNTRTSTRFTDIYGDVYAVTIPGPEYAFLTMYFSADAPDTPPISGFEELVTTPLEVYPITSLGLKYFAQDLYYPRGQNIVVAPGGYYDNNY